MMRIVDRDGNALRRVAGFSGSRGEVVPELYDGGGATSGMVVSGKDEGRRLGRDGSWWQQPSSRGNSREPSRGGGRRTAHDR